MDLQLINLTINKGPHESIRERPTTQWKRKLTTGTYSLPKKKHKGPLNVWEDVWLHTF